MDRSPVVEKARTIRIEYAAEGDEDTLITVAFLGPSMLSDLEAYVEWALS